jgi:SHS2 domain-containing protein
MVSGDQIQMIRMLENRYTIIEHEADIGLEIYGKNLSELFIHGGEALFSLITDPDTIEARCTRKITMNNEEESLVVFLNELLYLWDAEKFLPCSLSVSEETGRLEFILAGELFDPGRHPVKKEIKAATYHKFAIQQQGNLLKATIFLDI